jgi:hypothetical protein
MRYNFYCFNLKFKSIFALLISHKQYNFVISKVVGQSIVIKIVHRQKKGGRNFKY